MALISGVDVVSGIDIDLSGSLSSISTGKDTGSFNADFTSVDVGIKEISGIELSSVDKKGATSKTSMALISGVDVDLSGSLSSISTGKDTGSFNADFTSVDVGIKEISGIELSSVDKKGATSKTSMALISGVDVDLSGSLSSISTGKDTGSFSADLTSVDVGIAEISGIELSSVDKKGETSKTSVALISGVDVDLSGSLNSISTGKDTGSFSADFTSVDVGIKEISGIELSSVDKKGATSKTSVALISGIDIDLSGSLNSVSTGKDTGSFNADFTSVDVGIKEISGIELSSVDKKGATSKTSVALISGIDIDLSGSLSSVSTGKDTGSFSADLTSVDVGIAEISGIELSSVDKKGETSKTSVALISGVDVDLSGSLSSISTGKDTGSFSADFTSVDVGIKEISGIELSSVDKKGATSKTSVALISGVDVVSGIDIDLSGSLSSISTGKDTGSFNADFTSVDVGIKEISGIELSSVDKKGATSKTSMALISGVDVDLSGSLSSISTGKDTGSFNADFTSVDVGIKEISGIELSSVDKKGATSKTSMALISGVDVDLSGSLSSISTGKDTGSFSADLTSVDVGIAEISGIELSSVDKKGETSKTSVALISGVDVDLSGSLNSISTGKDTGSFSADFTSVDVGIKEISGIELSSVDKKGATSKTSVALISGIDIDLSGSLNSVSTGKDTGSFNADFTSVDVGIAEISGIELSSVDKKGATSKTSVALISGVDVDLSGSLSSVSTGKDTGSFSADLSSVDVGIKEISGIELSSVDKKGATSKTSVALISGVDIDLSGSLSSVSTGKDTGSFSADLSSVDVGIKEISGIELSSVDKKGATSKTSVALISGVDVDLSGSLSSVSTGKDTGSFSADLTSVDVGIKEISGIELSSVDKKGETSKTSVALISGVDVDLSGSLNSISTGKDTGSFNADFTSVDVGIKEISGIELSSVDKKGATSKTSVALISGIDIDLSGSLSSVSTGKDTGSFSADLTSVDVGIAEISGIELSSVDKKGATSKTSVALISGIDIDLSGSLSSVSTGKDTGSFSADLTSVDVGIAEISGIELSSVDKKGETSKTSVALISGVDVDLSGSLSSISTGKDTGSFSADFTSVDVGIKEISGIELSSVDKKGATSKTSVALISGVDVDLSGSLSSVSTGKDTGSFSADLSSVDVGIKEISGIELSSVDKKGATSKTSVALISGIDIDLSGSLSSVSTGKDTGSFSANLTSVDVGIKEISGIELSSVDKKGATSKTSVDVVSGIDIDLSGSLSSVSTGKDTGSFSADLSSVDVGIKEISGIELSSVDKKGATSKTSVALISGVDVDLSGSLSSVSTGKDTGSFSADLSSVDVGIKEISGIELSSVDKKGATSKTSVDVVSGIDVDLSGSLSSVSTGKDTGSFSADLSSVDVGIKEISGIELSSVDKKGATSDKSIDVVSGVDIDLSGSLSNVSTGKDTGSFSADLSSVDVGIKEISGIELSSVDKKGATSKTSVDVVSGIDIDLSGSLSSVSTGKDTGSFSADLSSVDVEIKEISGIELSSVDKKGATSKTSVDVVSGVDVDLSGSLSSVSTGKDTGSFSADLSSVDVEISKIKGIELSSVDKDGATSDKSIDVVSGVDVDLSGSLTSISTGKDTGSFSADLSSVDVEISKIKGIELSSVDKDGATSDKSIDVVSGVDVDLSGSLTSISTGKDTGSFSADLTNVDVEISKISGIELSSVGTDGAESYKSIDVVSGVDVDLSGSLSSVSTGEDIGSFSADLTNVDVEISKISGIELSSVGTDGAESYKSIDVVSGVDVDLSGSLTSVSTGEDIGSFSADLTSVDVEISKVKGIELSSIGTDGATSDTSVEKVSGIDIGLSGTLKKDDHTLGADFTSVDVDITEIKGIELSSVDKDGATSDTSVGVVSGIDVGLSGTLSKDDHTLSADFSVDLGVTGISGIELSSVDKDGATSNTSVNTVSGVDIDLVAKLSATSNEKNDHTLNADFSVDLGVTGISGIELSSVDKDGATSNTSVNTVSGISLDFAGDLSNGLDEENNTVLRADFSNIDLDVVGVSEIELSSVDKDGVISNTSVGSISGISVDLVGQLNDPTKGEDNSIFNADLFIELRNAEVRIAEINEIELSSIDQDGASSQTLVEKVSGISVDLIGNLSKPYSSEENNSTLNIDLSSVDLTVVEVSGIELSSVDKEGAQSYKSIDSLLDISASLAGQISIKSHTQANGEKNTMLLADLSTVDINIAELNRLEIASLDKEGIEKHTILSNISGIDVHLAGQFSNQASGEDSSFFTADLSTLDLDVSEISGLQHSIIDQDGNKVNLSLDKLGMDVGMAINIHTAGRIDIETVGDNQNIELGLKDLDLGLGLKLDYEREDKNGNKTKLSGDLELDLGLEGEINVSYSTQEGLEAVELDIVDSHIGLQSEGIDFISEDTNGEKTMYSGSLDADIDVKGLINVAHSKESGYKFDIDIDNIGLDLDGNLNYFHRDKTGDTKKLASDLDLDADLRGDAAVRYSKARGLEIDVNEISAQLDLNAQVDYIVIQRNGAYSTLSVGVESDGDFRKELGIRFSSKDTSSDKKNSSSNLDFSKLYGTGLNLDIYLDHLRVNEDGTEEGFSKHLRRNFKGSDNQVDESLDITLDQEIENLDIELE